ncbi:MAG: aspartate-semialdehyde dehydrogenase [Phycisphaeraceae bacterium]|nr:aspartate-semialdehyde dehydrogenase [Phycisphaeraceae bacterium]MBX3365914.1 aspartate-semialdehyde dehydrogenase [Phycisphaeraceae bacterium]
MPIQTCTVAVVGATGAVGREALTILHQRGVPAERVIALASERSAGASVEYGSAGLTVVALDERSAERTFHLADVAIFCADADTARRFVPIAVERGSLVVDNSSAFRMDPTVPLVVPEVNGAQLDAGAEIVANPNCSTILLLVAIEPLRRRFGVKSLVVSTYQAVSGAGLAAIEELRTQARESLAGRETTPVAFREPCAFNVFSHDSAIDPATGLNTEEKKLIEETRKIWGDSRVSITPTCIRVPVERAHSESVVIELREPAHEDEIRLALASAAGVSIIDDRAANAFPTPLKASGIDDVLVGRIRPDPGAGFDGRGRCTRWCLWLSGDQIRKGAALNAIQIAERLVQPARRLPPAANIAHRRTPARFGSFIASK